MTPAKRRPAKPASQETTGAATEDSTEDASTPDARGDSAPPTESPQVDPEDTATKQSPRRSRGRYPLPVWPD